MKKMLMTATLCLCSLMLLGAKGGCNYELEPTDPCVQECRDEYKDCMTWAYTELTMCESACPPYTYPVPSGYRECRTVCTNEARIDENQCGVTRRQCVNGCPSGAKSAAAMDVAIAVDVQGQDGRLNPYWVPLGSQVELVAGMMDISEGVPFVPDVCDEPGWADYRGAYLLPTPGEVELVTFEYLPWSVFDTLSMQDLIAPGGPWIYIGEARRSFTHRERNLAVSLDVTEAEFELGTYVIRATSYTDALPAPSGEPGPLTPNQQMLQTGGEVGFGELMTIPYTLEDICAE